MEKLNEVAAFLDRNPGLADCVVQITYSEMYDIAKALRELEQDRNKFAEECIKHNNMAFKFQQRAEAAEAELAERGKQEPTGLLAINTGGGWRIADEAEYIFASGHGFSASELYTRPATAADLADLLPDVEKWRSPEAVRAQMAYRAAILRNIEDAE